MLDLQTPIEIGTEEDFEYLQLLARVKIALGVATDVAIPVEEIRAYKNQPRVTFKEESLQRLSTAIDLGGQTAAGMIRLKPGETPYELVDGERRWRAISMIPSERRPLYNAKLIEADDEVVQFLISSMANCGHELHTPMEMCSTIERMRRLKFPMKEVAGLLGITESWAGQIHGLKNLVREVSDMLDPEQPKERKLPLTAAIQISKIEPRLQLGLAQRVLSKDITLVRLRGEVVKAATREGSHIRVRELSPLKQWESLGNKVVALSRYVDDVEHLLQKGDVTHLVQVRSETDRHLRLLVKARDGLYRIETKMRKNRPR
jgi:hypothetical protein